MQKKWLGTTARPEVNAGPQQNRIYSLISVADDCTSPERGSVPKPGAGNAGTMTPSGAGNAGNAGGPSGVI